MNKKHYEEIIAADPAADFDGMDLTVEERSLAAGFRDEMLALDEKIAAALTIAVPPLNVPELPTLNTDNVAHMPTSNKSRFPVPVWVGLAASVALIAVVGARFVDIDSGYPSLGEEIAAHLDHETHAMVVSSTPVREDDLQNVFEGSGADLDRGVGLISYARSCPINGNNVPHLVLQGENGPITVLLMPDERLDQAEAVEGQSIRGVILPVGEGSIAIIGGVEEDLDEIRKQVVDSVTWSI